MSQNEWKTTEIRASKVGHFSPFSCPGLAELQWRVADADAGRAEVAVAEARRLDDAAAAVADHADAFHAALIEALRVVCPAALPSAADSEDEPAAAAAVGLVRLGGRGSPRAPV